MIRTNLSTRPFYNETAVRFWLIVLAVAVVAATVFNVQRLISYSSRDTDLAARATRDEQRAKQLVGEAARLRSTVDVAQIEATSVEARVANDLIDRRTFSWTALFNEFEKTLPSEVRITTLRQRLDRSRGGTVLSITLVARSVDDINDFMEKLEGTAAFSDLIVSQEQVDPDDGQLAAVLQAVYHPGGPKAAAVEPAGIPTDVAPAPVGGTTTP